MPRLRRSSLFAVALCLGAGCEEKSPQEFNQEAAALVCAIEHECGDILSAGFLEEFPDNFTCEDVVLNEYEACASNCEYRVGAARRCIDRLEFALDTCEVPNLRSCRRAYWACPDDCQIWNCSVQPGARPLGGIAFGLFVVVLVALRPRRERTPPRA